LQTTGRIRTPNVRGVAPVTMRSQLMLEAAAHLVAASGWNDRQVEINFRPQGGDQWKIRLFASDAPNSIDEVASGRADIAICNPGAVLGMALKGRGPFKQPIPVRAIFVLPQFDQYAFAVRGDLGITSLGDIRDKRYPLRVSLRGQRDHSVHLVADLVLETYGYSMRDIESWGGAILMDEELPSGPNRIGRVQRGEADAVWDEAVQTFGHRALDMGMCFLPVDEANLRQLEDMGLKRVAIPKEIYTALDADVWTVDFSGWPVFCLESTPDTLVTAFCEAVEARKANIPWYGHGPMDLKAMVSDTPDAPMTIPLHPAAQRFWQQQGYLS
jgi:TRAP-type uncharacterized transport system substrate-binding protein